MGDRQPPIESEPLAHSEWPTVAMFVRLTARRLCGAIVAPQHKPQEPPLEGGIQIAAHAHQSSCSVSAALNEEPEWLALAYTRAKSISTVGLVYKSENEAVKAVDVPYGSPATPG